MAGTLVPGWVGGWVAERGGRVVGYLELEATDPSRSVMGFLPVHPDERESGLRPALLDLALTNARNMPGEADAPLWVTGSASDATFIRDMEAAGFVHVRTFWHMERSVAPAPSPPPLPPGVTVRVSMDPEDDPVVYAVLDEAFRGHFGIEPMTFEAWVDEFKGGSYDPGLVLIAEAEGRPAGVAANWLPEGIGWVGDLGVLPAFRGGGIGTALLWRSFVELAERGATEVRLNVDAGNESGAVRLYTSVGMHEHRRFLVYEKSLRPGG